MSRKIQFIIGEYYHIFNRGTDKRAIFIDRYDLERFFQSMNEFNSVEPIGSIYENFLRSKDRKNGNGVSMETPFPKHAKKLVNFACYCLNPNHYHFILTPIVDKGVEKFLHKVGLGYAKYFNNKYERSGVLFQGPFKAIHIDSNEYLLYLSAYINLNNKVHQLGRATSKLSKSSWGEYIGENKENFCEKEIILSQFKNKQILKLVRSGRMKIKRDFHFHSSLAANYKKEYKEFAEESLKIIRENKDIGKFLLEV